MSAVSSFGLLEQCWCERRRDQRDEDADGEILPQTQFDEATLKDTLSTEDEDGPAQRLLQNQSSHTQGMAADAWPNS